MTLKSKIRKRLNCTNGKIVPTCDTISKSISHFLTEKKSDLNTSTHRDLEREATPPPDGVASKKRQTKIGKNARKMVADMTGSLAESTSAGGVSNTENERVQEWITKCFNFGSRKVVKYIKLGQF